MVKVLKGLEKERKESGRKEESRIVNVRAEEEKRCEGKGEGRRRKGPIK